MKQYCQLKVIVCALSPFLLSCSEKEKRGESAPSVFVIVLDAASAGHFGCYGDKTGTSPHIDQFASESILFENAYSQTPSTLLSTVSFLTGTRTSTHQMNEGIKVPKRLKTMPELMSNSGFKTFSVVGNPFAGSPNWGLDRGYNKCIEVYKLDHVIARRVPEESRAFAVTQPDDINEEIYKLLPEWKKTGTYAYIHFLQPHKPYDPPEKFLKAFDCGSASWKSLHVAWEHANSTGNASQGTIRSLEERYRANIKYVDAAVGALFTRLKSAGLYNESMIVLTADHGDAFFKHGRFGHNTDLYDDMVRIPLIIKFPNTQKVRPARRTSLTETIDLMPTILDYVGLPIPEQVEGESLLNVAFEHRDSLAGEEVILGAIVNFGQGPTATSYEKHAIRVREYKYIRHAGGQEEVFNLRIDPDEQHDLSKFDKAAVLRFRELLESRVNLKSGSTVVAERASGRDQKMDSLLYSLGYTGGETSGGGSNGNPTSQPSSRATTTTRPASMSEKSSTQPSATIPSPVDDDC